MAVMTHAPARLEANYRNLSTDDQDRFDQLMERADHAGPHDYQPLMDALAVLTGISGEIRKCACSCTCPSPSTRTTRTPTSSSTETATTSAATSARGAPTSTAKPPDTPRTGAGHA
ncbi:hypothetical protein D3C59_33785 [Streptomyces sp. SHP22-7]|nr:hypothetical protein D3C59_33785 [Streptomyces sp. SHP22-7]